jgi:hypothetical protein
MGYAQVDVTVEITFAGQPVLNQTISMRHEACVRFDIPSSDVHLWSPEHPNLYDVSFRVYERGTCIDEVHSYVALRTFKTADGNVLLNNEPYYLRLILDQGYYPDGLISYPDEDQLKRDIVLAKDMGFNGCRKHEKVEAERFLYYADTLGFLVSIEMPSAYSFRASEAFTSEWLRIINRDYNHPSVFQYVPFNESWGVRNIATRKDIQDYVTGFYHLTKSIDPTRLVSSNDGWEQTITDLCSIHNYQHGSLDDLAKQETFRQSILEREHLLSSIHTPQRKPLYVGGYQYRKEPILLSEFGGISFANHQQDGWGYTGVGNEDDYIQELRRIFDIVHQSQHLAGFCYTQLTDVEQEINGLLDYHRNPKIPISVIRSIVTNQD